MADHYRTALSIIASAPGEERPVLQAYLQGKDGELFSCFSTNSQCQSSSRLRDAIFPLV